MLIDWFTVIAQVVNFLILVWLMKRFLYKPILSAIDARESGIAAKLADADAKKAEAEKEREKYQHKSEAFEQQRIDLLHKATEDAEAEHQRLLTVARTDADTARSGWQDALRNEQHSFEEEIVRRTQAGVFGIAQKMLTELATVSLEECMTDVFVARLRGLSGTERDVFAVALRSSSQPAILRSAFDLTPAQQAAIGSAVSGTFALQSPIHFETAPSLISGIELSANGQNVIWSISDFLTSLKTDVGALVKERTDPATLSIKPEAKPGNAVQNQVAVPKSKPEPIAQLAGR